MEKAREWIGLDNDALCDAISCSLEMLNAEPLKPAARQGAGRGSSFLISKPGMVQTHLVDHTRYPAQASQRWQARLRMAQELTNPASSLQCATRH